MSAVSRLCPVCQHHFLTVRKHQLCCSKACSQLNLREERLCATCQQPYIIRATYQKYCSEGCQPWRQASQSPWLSPLPSGTVGALAELRIGVDLMMRGYDVFRALSPSCYCDLLASKQGIILHVEARTGYDAEGRLQFSAGYKPGVTCMAVWNKRRDTVHYLVPGTREEMVV